MGPGRRRAPIHGGADPCGVSAAGGGLRGAEWWLRAAVTSGRVYLRRDFRGHEVDHLYAPWLLHAGLSPDHAAGGFMTRLFAGTLHGFGLPVVAGGAGRFRELPARIA